MADLDDIFASKYLKAIDLNGRTFKMTIARVTVEKFTERDGRDKVRPVVFFNGAHKGLLLNKTNAFSIGSAYGKNTDAWIGKALELYPDTTLFGGQPTPCIRVRPVYPQANAPLGVSPGPVMPQAPAPPPLSQPMPGEDWPGDPAPF